jgi:hypothetical protein
MSGAKREPADAQVGLSYPRHPAHVVVLADNQVEDETIVVTLYEPDVVLWQPGFRKRRRP